MIAELFLKIYASQGGIIARWITGGIVSAIVSGLTMLFKKEPSPELIVSITTIVTLGVTTVIADIVTKVQLNYGKAVQESINEAKPDFVPTVIVDGRAGPETQAALKDAVSAVNVMAKDLTKKEEKTVIIEMVNEQTAPKPKTP